MISKDNEASDALLGHGWLMGECIYLLMLARSKPWWLDPGALCAPVAEAVSALKASKQEDISAAGHADAGRKHGLWHLGLLHLAEALLVHRDAGSNATKWKALADFVADATEWKAADVSEMHRIPSICSTKQLLNSTWEGVADDVLSEQIHSWLCTQWLKSGSKTCEPASKRLRIPHGIASL